MNISAILFTFSSLAGNLADAEEMRGAFKPKRRRRWRQRTTNKNEQKKAATTPPERLGILRPVEKSFHR